MLHAQKDSSHQDDPYEEMTQEDLMYVTRMQQQLMSLQNDPNLDMEAMQAKILESINS